LQAGVLGGLTLPAFLRQQAAQAAEGRPTRATSVILFWCSGGPGHMETWDPKPDALAEYRGPFGAIATRVNGVRFGELLPCQARVADKLAIIRGVNHGSGDHTACNHWMLTGFQGPRFDAADLAQLKPSMGSAVSQLRGANRPGMPPYVA